MTGQQLKNSILQLAIQGKLVPQDPNDEPASELLKRIRKEKEQLVKAGKLKKKDLEVTPIAEDEKEFDLPKGWEWCKIGELFLHTSGKQQSSNNKEGGTPQKFITTSNLYWNRFELDNVKVMNFTDEEVKTCSATKGDLLVCEGGAGYGRSAIWPYDYDICLQNHVHRLRPIINGTCEFVYYIIYLLKESNRLASVGTAMPGLSANRLKNIVLALPPLAEQKRIVAKIEELLPLVEEYGNAQEELNKLNATLPDKLRQSILQEAIMGKLVPQDPNDEPASKLLERIQEEKKRLVKEGKLKKKDLEVTPITDEEKPFDLPNGWEWCYIGDLFAHNNGKQLNRGNSNGELMDYITTSNLYWDYFVLDSIKQMPFAENEIERCQAIKGDLLVCEGGDIGRSAIWNYDYPIMLQNHIHKLRGYLELCTKYFYYLFYYYNKAGLIGGKGIGIQGFSSKALHFTKVPLPPLAEQHRIVLKLEEILTRLNELK